MSNADTFDSHGVHIAYDDRPPEGAGDAPPIVLVHGFASNRHNNWQEPSWYETMADLDRRVIALDCRGHGESGKPHDEDAYSTGTMAGDVIGLLDYLDVEEADLMGYSMGGRITVELVTSHPERFNSAVAAGVGSSILDGRSAGGSIADGLVTDDPDSIDNPVARRFRIFAESNDNDLEALAACIRSPSSAPNRDELADVDLPVLVVAGSEDDLVGTPGGLADAFGNGESVTVEGEDHLSTVGDERYKDAVRDFLGRNGL